MPLDQLASSPTSSPSDALPVDNGSQVSGEVDALCGFLRLIDSLPKEYQGDFYRTLERLVTDVERRRRILESVQDSLAQMRTDLKYLVFDLEATRRERDEYRRRLENSSNGL